MGDGTVNNADINDRCKIAEAGKEEQEEEKVMDVPVLIHDTFGGDSREVYCNDLFYCSGMKTSASGKRRRK
jgi:hypothetical protein